MHRFLTCAGVLVDFILLMPPLNPRASTFPKSGVVFHMPFVPLLILSDHRPTLRLRLRSAFEKTSFFPTLPRRRLFGPAFWDLFASVVITSGPSFFLPP